MFFISAGIAPRRALAIVMAVFAGAACGGVRAADMLPVTANEVLALPHHGPIHTPFAGGAVAVDSATLAATVAFNDGIGNGNLAPLHRQTLRDRLAQVAAELPRGQVYPAGTLDRSERLRSPDAPPAAAPLAGIRLSLASSLAPGLAPGLGYPGRIGVDIAVTNTTSVPGTVILTPLGQVAGR